MYYIIGAGGHARSILGILESTLASSDVRLVDYKNSQSASVAECKHGVHVLNMSLNDLFAGKDDDISCILGIGELRERLRIIIAIKQNALHFPTVISDTAKISLGAKVSRLGTVVHDRVFIGVGASIGAFSIINTGAIVEHNVVVGRNTHIAPGSVLTGGCTVGDNVFVGAGAILTNSANIPSGCVIGAGAVVTRSLLQNDSTYIGVPAKLRD
ncbi:hypothetical protein QWJ17_00175 [Betaproteobacteria bacterium LSUCC0117]|nr:hypothetical protein [Betaproteobacteria bacterium LSUCC0117]